MRRFIIFLLAAFLPACAKVDSIEDGTFFRNLQEAEEKLGMAYFSQRSDLAMVGLDDYLKFLRTAEPLIRSSDAKRALYTGRALALIRLEFLKASLGHTVPNLAGAIDSMRVSGPEMIGLSDRQISIALVEMIRGDVDDVPWLKDFDRLSEPTRQP